MDEFDHQLPRSRAAIEQLEQALQRLESTVARKGGDLFLGEELRTARDDYTRLDAVTRTVEAKLDGVIDRLKTLLED